MDWSTRRKFGFIAIFTVIVLLIAGIFVYFKFVREVPTCMDGKQNQNERGVDCGGLCEQVCRTDAKQLVRLWSRAFESTPGIYSAVAYIENQNVRAGTDAIRYEFRFYDDRNILVAGPITGETFFGPNERTAIFLSGIETGNRVPTSVFFRFLNEPTWKRTNDDYASSQLVTSEADLTDEGTLPKLSAKISNPTPRDFRDIDVIAILYGADGNVVTASQTHLDELLRDSDQMIFFTWQKPLITPIVRTELIPRVDPASNR